MPAISIAGLKRSPQRCGSTWNLLEDAPPLKASSLDAPYKLLADFNDYVLGGMESSHGVQFTTRQWTYGKDGLTLGRYCGNDYTAAKRDFALRSGPVQEQKQFTPEQLIEIYRCCADTMTSDIPLARQQEKRIDEIQTQITEMYPTTLSGSSRRWSKTLRPSKPCKKTEERFRPEL